MTRLMTWLATIVLLVAAGIVSSVAPADDASITPFFVSGEVGEQVVGRDLIATVTDARTASSVTGDWQWATDDYWTSDGSWLVVDLDVESVVGPRVAYITGSSSLGSVEFVLDGLEYRATERTTSMLNVRLTPGVPRHGSVAFELPALSGSGVLRLSTKTDTRADSVLEIPIDLDAITAESEVEILAPEWVK